MHNNDDTMMPLNLINFKDSFREDFNNNSDFNRRDINLNDISNLKY